MSALNSIRPRLTIAREQDTYSSSRSRRSAGGQSRPQDSGVGAAALPQGIHSPARRERAKRLHSQAHDNSTDDDSYATESLRLGSAPKDVPDALGHADPRTTRAVRLQPPQPRPLPKYRLAAAHEGLVAESLTLRVGKGGRGVRVNQRSPPIRVRMTAPVAPRGPVSTRLVPGARMSRIGTSALNAP